MKVYVIECRKPDGTLDFSGAQPESVFGQRAVTGMDADSIADVVFATFHRIQKTQDLPIPMHGGNIPDWPKNIDQRWSAREKTW